ncbi:MAG: hypothetical protein GX804_03445 [Lentisphaerae bacterium]|nr:hypothetical protein [Lentisphaerota bacterium]
MPLKSGGPIIPVPIRITAELLANINDDPMPYTVTLEDWTDEKAAYLAQLEKLFSLHIVEAEKSLNAFTYLTQAINRWYMALPQYAKTLSLPDKSKVRFMASLRQPDINPREYLFETLPAIFGKTASLSGVADMVAAAK